jgi:hypothetical protein
MFTIFVRRVEHESAFLLPSNRLSNDEVPKCLEQSVVSIGSFALGVLVSENPLVAP